MQKQMTKFRNTFYEVTTKFKATMREIHFHLSNDKKKDISKRNLFLSVHGVKKEVGIYLYGNV